MPYFVIYVVQPEYQISSEHWGRECQQGVNQDWKCQSAQVRSSAFSCPLTVGVAVFLRAFATTMRVQLIGHFKPCMTEIYLHI